MKKLIFAVVLLSSVTGFAKSGDITVLHSAVNPKAITFSTIPGYYHINIGPLVYSNGQYVIDPQVQGNLVEAERQGAVIDVLKEDNGWRGDDIIKFRIRPATAEEKSNIFSQLKDENLRLMNENQRLKELVGK